MRTDTTRSERIAGLVWLSIGALFCLFVSVLYIATRVTVGEWSVPLPWPIIFSAILNYALTTTALLWTPNRLVAAIPIGVWTLGFVVLAMWPALPLGGDTLVPSSPWSVGLMIAGMMGGMWPLLPRFPIEDSTVEQ